MSEEPKPLVPLPDPKKSLDSQTEKKRGSLSPTGSRKSSALPPAKKKPSLVVPPAHDKESSPTARGQKESASLPGSKKSSLSAPGSQKGSPSQPGNKENASALAGSKKESTSPPVDENAFLSPSDASALPPGKKKPSVLPPSRDKGSFSASRGQKESPSLPGSKKSSLSAPGSQKGSSLQPGNKSKASSLAGSKTGSTSQPAGSKKGSTSQPAGSKKGSTSQPVGENDTSNAHLAPPGSDGTNWPVGKNEEQALRGNVQYPLQNQQNHYDPFPLPEAPTSPPSTADNRRNAIIAVVVVIAVVVAALLLLRLSKAKISTEDSSTTSTMGTSLRGLCESEACQRVASQLRRGLNPRSPPCDDFYEHVCGAWKDPGCSISSAQTWLDRTTDGTWWKSLACVVYAPWIIRRHGDYKNALKHHRRFCFAITEKSAGYAFLAPYVKTAFSTKVEDDITDTLRQVRGAYATLLAESEAFRPNMSALPSYATNSGRVFDLFRVSGDAALEERYAQYEDMTSDPLENWKRLRVGLTKSFYGHVTMDSAGAAVKTVRFFTLDYVNFDFTLRPDVAVLPFFDSSLPAELKLAGLGSITASAMAETLHASLGWTQPASHAWNETHACMHAHGLPPRTSSESDLLKRTLALAAVVTALKKPTDGAAPLVLRDVPELSGIQLLFAAWCNLKCGEAYGRQLCNEPVRELRSFADTFHCGADAKMRKTTTCTARWF
ncbi:hypothetical protein HPB48_007777 [Haemaphysalis longicornis]|uniref:Uncharacterized protein n=1 Tax=Haemaphysalis longicornis TaxID=44386 RepID=A0A9J6GE54_HAELO|nr:hypothetical protein HPB48_007777 [Haemaphysalis longicornis]